VYFSSPRSPAWSLVTGSVVQTHAGELKKPVFGQVFLYSQRHISGPVYRKFYQAFLLPGMFLHIEQYPGFYSPKLSGIVIPVRAA
jgi:hypothetical protein